MIVVKHAHPSQCLIYLLPNCEVVHIHFLQFMPFLFLGITQIWPTFRLPQRLLKLAETGIVPIRIFILQLQSHQVTFKRLPFVVQFN